MSLTFSNFEKLLEKKFLYENNPKLAVGVSGGPDSLALTMLLQNWIKKKKGRLIALIVDHRIRVESLAESIQTKNFLTSRGITSKILYVSKKKVARGKLSQARTNRFEKLFNYCKKNKIFHLFLGHHYDDNLETFILRKIAGSNFEGLNSIQFLSILGNIQVLRPLLFYTKKEILSFNKKRNLKFINDPSNQNTKYARVAVRSYLDSNENMKKEINKEFKLVKNNYHLYKTMIYQILNLIVIKVELKKLIINSTSFSSLNFELRENILIKSIKYVHGFGFQIRSTKVKDLIEKISKFHDISIKVHKTLINRIDDKIIITKI